LLDEVTVAVPAIGYRQQRWEPVPTGYYSRRELQRQSGPYEAAVTPSIEDLDISLPMSLVADLGEATSLLEDFDRHSSRHLGDGAVGPMSAILLRTESASSSQIEQLTTSARQLALAEIDETEKANARQVVANVRAMEAALRLSDSLDESTVLEMHRTLLPEDEIGGRFRPVQVWIGKPDAGPIGADFVPPVADDVPAAVRDALAFARRDDLLPLAQIAIAHAQFETIHPFEDGNGRTGRALVQAMLRRSGLVSHTTAPVSAGLLIDVAGYFDALTAFRRGDAAPILTAFVRAARYAAISGRRLVDDLTAELEKSREKLTGLRSQANAWKVLPLLVGQPVVNGAYVTRELGFVGASLTNALAQLTERGVLAEKTGLRRNRVWQHDGILRVLDDYAATIRRDHVRR